MADEFQPWYVSAWNFFISARPSYNPDMLGRFSHPKSFLTRVRHILSALNFQGDDFLFTRPYLGSLA